jgi:hypothetical protein
MTVEAEVIQKFSAVCMTDARDHSMCGAFREQILICSHRRSSSPFLLSLMILLKSAVSPHSVPPLSVPNPLVILPVSE